MRRIASLLLLAPALVLASQGCTLDLCTDFPGVCDPAGQGGSGGGTTSSGTSGGGTGGAAGGGGEGGGVVIPTECDPREAGPTATIPETCGVFIDVNSTANTSEGTKAAPFKDFAVINNPQLASVQLFYVCATPSGAPIDEQLVIERSAVIFGGFVDCTDWTVPAEEATERTAWTAPQHEIPAVVRGTGVSVLLSRFAIESLDANGFDPRTLQGRSSVGMWVEDASVTLIDSSVTAGAGAPGGEGAGYLPSDRAPGRTASDTSFDGNRGGDSTQDDDCGEPPGSSLVKVCPNMPVALPLSERRTIGGGGGAGNLTNGTSGSAGSPNYSTSPGSSDPGLGEFELDPWSCNGEGNGKPGDNGANGSVGMGGTSLGEVAVTPADGLVYIGSPGAEGGIGKVGAGGGGGAGRKGDGENSCNVGESGPPGGGGAAGGCAGLAGSGGGAGGASIAIVAVRSSLSFTGLTVLAGPGGQGGRGGLGQLGGLGGIGGLGGGSACQGGAGGEGGRGGHGGGGRGGASIGVAHIGPGPVAEIEDAITTAPAPAAGGLGGNNSTSNAGAEGIVAKIQEFPAP